MTDDRSASLTSAATPSTISFLGKHEKKNGHNKSQIKECARDNVFPVAKFLRLEDLPFTGKKKSWCRKMTQWCAVHDNYAGDWWLWARKTLLAELAFQKSTKTNMIKREFVGEEPSKLFVMHCRRHC